MVVENHGDKKVQVEQDKEAFSAPHWVKGGGVALGSKTTFIQLYSK